MDEEEIWLSDDAEEDFEDDELQVSQDPTAFGLSLTYQGGQSGGKS